MIHTALALEPAVPVPLRPGLAFAREEASLAHDPLRVFEAGLRHHHLANTAYPIAHRKTIWRYRQPADRHAALLASALSPATPMSLYVHIPFCERRCAYCEYCVVQAHTKEAEAAYHTALLAELERYVELLGPGRQLAGFDIGGGTPSAIDPARIAEIVEQVERSFRRAPGVDISIETTPRIAALHPERLRAYRAAGIGRISMGLQMVNPHLLRAYERDLNQVGHNRTAVDHIRAAGFRRFNIDLMYGFARQTVEDFRRSLAYAVDLAPEYITLYRMRYKGTRVQRESAAVELERVVQMYEAARDILGAAGYHAPPGKNGFSRVPDDTGASEYCTSRVIWSTPYLGLGLGAQTFTNNLLGYNLGAADKRLERYIAATSRGELPIQDLYHLPLGEGMAKMISISFYFGQIHLDAFSRRFGTELEQRFPREVAFVIQRGLMRFSGPTLRLTEKGAHVFNGVVALFYSDAVKQHLLDLPAREAHDA